MNDYRVNGRKMLNDEKFTEGRAKVLAIAMNPAARTLVEKHAKIGHTSVRGIPVTHKPGSKKTHEAGVSARLGLEDQGISLTLASPKEGQENFLPAPPGGSWTIMCAGCGANIVRTQAGLMEDTLKVLALRGTAEAPNSVTLR